MYPGCGDLDSAGVADFTRRGVAGLSNWSNDNGLIRAVSGALVLVIGSLNLDSVLM